MGLSGSRHTVSFRPVWNVRVGTPQRMFSISLPVDSNQSDNCALQVAIVDRGVSGRR